MVDWIADWLSDVGDVFWETVTGLICAGQQVLCWAWAFFLDMAVWLLEGLEAIGIDKDVLGPLQQFYSVLSYWLPLNELLVLLAGVQSIALFVICWRLVKKHIPTLG